MSKKQKSQTINSETVSLPKAIKSHGYVYKDAYKRIERIIAKFDGFNKEYFVSDFGEKSAVLVVSGNQILFVRQYRLLINRLSFEIPGGKVDKSESPKESAARECYEETGVMALNLKLLIEYDPDLEYTRNHTFVYYSNEIETNLSKNSERYEWIAVNECLKMIADGIIADSLSINAIMAYDRKFRAKNNNEY